nr:MmcQ/YjbR family DNA-binding protein [Paremcibacter congregatus]
MMSREEFDDYCRNLTSTTNVIQWGNASVWKVGGKIFAICSHWGVGETQKISFKCSDLSYQVLCELPGITPAPYLARAKWVQIADPDAMSEQDVKDYIRTAHNIIAQKLTQKMRAELGLDLLKKS